MGWRRRWKGLASMAGSIIRYTVAPGEISMVTLEWRPPGQTVNIRPFISGLCGPNV